MNVLVLLLLLVGLVLFLVEGFRVASSRLNLTALGLAAVTGAFLVENLA